MEVSSWVVRRPGEDMVLETREENPGPAEVLVEVAGCGVCHTDLSFFFAGVQTRHPYPLTLGHEVSGRVVATGAGVERLCGQSVVVPAVIPCGACPACESGHGSVCEQQIFPGNDVHGGFGSHLRVPAQGLCPVPDLDDARINPGGLDLATLSVIADAVSTPYQAIKRSGLDAGDLAIFVGAGGVGGFGLQIARAIGAITVAIDIDSDRLATAETHGADLCLSPTQTEFKELRRALRNFAREREIPSWRRQIFETSGSPQGQQLAFGLLTHGSYLSVIGYTAKKVELRLSNLMALDAKAVGNWGCHPDLYPEVLDLVLHGKIELQACTQRRSLSDINEVFQQLRAHSFGKRIVLIP